MENREDSKKNGRQCKLKNKKYIPKHNSKNADDQR